MVYVTNIFVYFVSFYSDDFYFGRLNMKKAYRIMLINVFESKMISNVSRETYFLLLYSYIIV